MTIDEAIGILVAKKKDDEERRATDSAEACQLGIEALKLVDNLRFDGSPYYPNLLPGETEE